MKKKSKLLNLYGYTVLYPNADNTVLAVSYVEAKNKKEAFKLVKRIVNKKIKIYLDHNIPSGDIE